MKRETIAPILSVTIRTHATAALLATLSHLLGCGEDPAVPPQGNSGVATSSSSATATTSTVTTGNAGGSSGEGGAGGAPGVGGGGSGGGGSGGGGAPSCNASSTAPAFGWKTLWDTVGGDVSGWLKSASTPDGLITLGSAFLTPDESTLIATSIRLARVTAQGDLVWETEVPVGQVGTDYLFTARDLAVDPSGSAVLAFTHFGAPIVGQFDLPEPLDQASVVVKFAPDGTLAWVKPIQTHISGDALVKSIATDLAGNVLVAGMFSGSLALGTESWTANAGARDGFVAKLDPSGEVVWATRFPAQGASDRLFAGPVAVGENGDVFVAASFRGLVQLGAQAFQSTAVDELAFVRLDANGTPVAASTFGGTFDATAQPWGLLMSGDSVFVAGHFTDSLAFGGTLLTSSNPYDADGFLAKLSADGDVLAAVRLGGIDGETAGDELPAIALDPAGNLVVATSFCGACADFGGGPLAGEGGDGCVAKLDSDLAHLWSGRFGGVYVYSVAASSERALVVAEPVNGGMFGPGISVGSLPLDP